MDFAFMHRYPVPPSLHLSLINVSRIIADNLRIAVWLVLYSPEKQEVFETFTGMKHFYFIHLFLLKTSFLVEKKSTWEQL